VQCRVTLPRDAPRIRVQVGAHARDFASVPPPWARWPAVCVACEAAAGEACVATPYGGLVYVAPVGPAPGRSFVVEFSEVCVAPAFSWQSPARWEQTTLETDCPWAEIHSRFLIVTLQTPVALAAPSIGDAVAVITDLLEAVNAVLALPEGASPARVVFDVGIPWPGVEIGYPTYVSNTWADVVLRPSAPSARLLQFIASVAMCAVPEHVFTPFFRAVLALLAASYAVAKRWPSAPVVLLPQLDGSALWALLSAILAKTGAEPFSAALARIRARMGVEKMVFSDAAEMFVATLSQRTKRPIKGLVELVLATRENPASPLQAIHGMTAGQAGN
jgi:hypothetical protein